MPQSEKKESLLAFVFETAEFLTKIFAVMLIDVRSFQQSLGFPMYHLAANAVFLESGTEVWIEFAQLNV